MLVLTRRVGEKLLLGENHEIEISVIGINGRQVKYGIKAPRHIHIDREELFNRKKSGTASYQAANDC